MGFKMSWRSAAMGMVAMTGVHCGEAPEAPAGVLAQQRQASETVTRPTDISSMARLGQGRDLVKEELRAECVRSANTVNLPNQSASLRFGSSMTREEASDLLGFKMDAKARFGLVNANARAKFSRSITSNALSLSMFYVADYKIGGQKLDEGSLQWLVAPGSPDWISRCGDEFMLQKEVGGQLFLLYRIDFSSQDSRSEFEAALGVSWPAGEVNAEMSSKASRFAGRASVHVEAYQYGGDVTQLASILGGSSSSGDAARTVLECNMNNLAPCGQFMQNAINYASSSSFASSMANQPADREYVFKDWGMTGVGIPVRSVGASVRQARFELRQLFDKQVEFQERVATLRSGQLYVPPSLRASLDGFESGVNRNLALIADAVRACYDQLTDPQDAAQVNACVNGASLGTLASRGFDTSLTIDRLSVDVRLPYVFGGLYQVDDVQQAQANNMPNPVTGQLSCPSGFHTAQIGRVLTAERLTGGTQYLCYAPHGSAQGWPFTGVYQTDDRGASGNNVNNIFGGGGGLGCPTGTGGPYRFGRARGPESGWGVNGYFCSPGTFSAEKMSIGGIYQLDDCGRNNVSNPFTGTLGCPDGFSAIQMSRVKAPESQCGARQFVCKMN